MDALSRVTDEFRRLDDELAAAVTLPAVDEVIRRAGTLTRASTAAAAAVITVGALGGMTAVAQANAPTGVAAAGSFVAPFTATGAVPELPAGADPATVVVDPATGATTVQRRPAAPAAGAAPTRGAPPVTAGPPVGAPPAGAPPVVAPTTGAPLTSVVPPVVPPVVTQPPVVTTSPNDEGSEEPPPPVTTTRQAPPPTTTRQAPPPSSAPPTTMASGTSVVVTSSAAEPT